MSFPDDNSELRRSYEVDQLCDRFESEWKSGNGPRLEDYLQDILGRNKESAFRELLQLEISLRRERGEAPDRADLEKRFPEELNVIAELFATDNDDIDQTIIGSAAGGISPGVGTSVRYFGEYELLEEIARGGMGVVFKARQVKLNRIVALKMILTGSLAGEIEVQRFHLEAEAVANLEHSGIVPIYEIGEHDGQHYFSMGFVEGQSLSDRVKVGPLPPREAAEIVKKVAEAVSYAHEKGVIHRDLKPANVLLDENGEPKVTDFGLAKRVESGGDLTRTGEVMGTPSYMSPEQARGETNRIDARTDVYSLGVTLFELLTGVPPFRGTFNIVLQKVLEQEATSLRRINKVVPIDLEVISLKCLRKERDHRYQSAADLAADLERYLDRRPIIARPVGRGERLYRWCRRNPLFAGFSAAFWILLLLFAAVQTDMLARHSKLTQSESTAKARADAAEEKLQSEQRTTQAAEQRTAESIRRAEEKTRLADEKQRLFEQESEQRQKLSDYANALKLVELAQRSSDSPVSRLLLAREACLATESPTSEAEAMLREALEAPLGFPLDPALAGTPLCVSVDNRLIASGPDQRLRIWNIDLLDPHAEPLELDGPKARISAWSMNSRGTRLVVAWRNGMLRLFDLTAVDPTKSALTLGDKTSEVSSIRITPSGSHLLTHSADETSFWDFTATDLFRDTRETRVNDILTPKVLLHEDKWDFRGRSDINSSTAPLVLAANGSRLATSRQGYTDRIFDLRLRDPIEMPLDLPPNADTGTPILSPDGTRLIANGGGNRVQIYDLRADVPTGEPMQLEAGSHPTMVATENGSFLVTSSFEMGIRAWDLRTDTTSDSPIILSTTQSSVAALTVSANGEWLATRHLEGDVDVWRLTADDPASTRITLNGGDLLKAAPTPNQWLKMSRDGSRLVLSVSEEDGHLHLWVWDLTDPDLSSSPLVVKDCRGLPMLSDGNRLVTRDPDGLIRVWNLDKWGKHQSLRYSPNNSNRLAPLKSNMNATTLSPSGQYLISGDTGGDVTLWDLTAEHPAMSPRSLGEHEGPVDVLRFLPEDQFSRRRLLVAGGSTASIWDLSVEDPSENGLVFRGQEQDIEAGSPRAAYWRRGAIRKAVIGPDGALIATAGPKSIRIWDLTSTDPGKPRYIMKVEEPVVALTFAKGGSSLIAGGLNGSVTSYDLSRNDPTANPIILADWEGRVESMLLIGKSRLAVGNADKLIRIYELDSDAPQETHAVLEGHGGIVSALAVTSDQQRLFSGSSDGTVRLWDLTAVQPTSIAVLRDLKDVLSLAVTPDDRRLIIGCSPGEVRLADLTGDAPMSKWMKLVGHTGNVRQLFVTPDGRGIVTVCNDGDGAQLGDNSARLWDLDMENLIRFARTLAGRELTELERSTHSIPQRRSVHKHRSTYRTFARALPANTSVPEF